MLVEIAIGDAYGAAFEYVQADVVHRHNDLKRYYKHPRHDIAAGCYTDDTQMSLALAEMLVEQKAWTPPQLAGKFVEVFNRDRREGYASGFYGFLKSALDGDDFLDRIKPDSEKSGAAMRSCPLGVLGSIEEIKEKASLQARITHDTIVGIETSIAVGLMVHYFLHDLGPKAGLGDFLGNHVTAPWNSTWAKPVGSNGYMSVRAAVSALLQTDSMTSLLKTCVNFTGDVDTVAAVALGAGSCCKEIKQDLPAHFYADMETGPFGADYLKSVDARLMSMVRRGK